MKNYQKTLVELNQEIPSIQKDKEGKLRGGFCALMPQEESLETRVQQNKNDKKSCANIRVGVNEVCNDGCTNNQCNDGCTNHICTTKSSVPGNGLAVGPASGSLMF